MKIENPKLILEEINERIKKMKVGMGAYKDPKDKRDKEIYEQYLYGWNELFSLRKALFHQEEIDAIKVQDIKSWKVYGKTAIARLVDAKDEASAVKQAEKDTPGMGAYKAEIETDTMQMSSDGEVTIE